MDTEEKVLLRATLAFPIRGGKIGLGIKAAKIGAGRYNGAGGGIEPDEDIAEAACREIREEWCVAVDPKRLRPLAVVDFHNYPLQQPPFTCRVFVCGFGAWRGTFRGTAELGPPDWFEPGTLPYSRMLPADRDWLPCLMEGKTIHAHAWYGPRQERTLKPTLVWELSREQLMSLWHA